MRRLIIALVLAAIAAGPALATGEYTCSTDQECYQECVERGGQNCENIMEEN
jgi:hypothetical protein